jgi:hypothetical protein
MAPSKKEALAGGAEEDECEETTCSAIPRIYFSNIWGLRD